MVLTLLLLCSHRQYPLCLCFVPFSPRYVVWMEKSTSYLPRILGTRQSQWSSLDVPKVWMSKINGYCACVGRLWCMSLLGCCIISSLTHLMSSGSSTMHMFLSPRGTSHLSSLHQNQNTTNCLRGSSSSPFLGGQTDFQCKVRPVSSHITSLEETGVTDQFPMP